MKYLISYDITSSKRRQRVVNVLLGYGYRVQRSVFEGIFTREDLSFCVNKLKNIIDPKTDSVRVYFLCSECDRKIEVMGKGKKITEIDYIVI